MPPDQQQSDEELMQQLAGGRQEALGPLYARYAQLILNLAAPSLDRAAAEEVVQDVFLAVWRNTAAFKPERGAFRPWVLQIAHFRILNELRRRSRRPQLESDPDDPVLEGLPDRAPPLDEAVSRASLRAAVRSALEELPPPQRQALGLALFEDMTHGEVAAELNLPLGTAKTRIRTGLQKLRGKLAPLAAGLALIAILAGLGIRYQSEEAARQRIERALALVTASDTQVILLTAAPGRPETMHGRYRARPGATIAVLTLSNFAPAPAGQTYQAWLLHAGAWVSLGTARPDSHGSARVIAEGPELAVLPDALRVTLEPAGGSPAPRGSVMIAWPAR